MTAAAFKDRLRADLKAAMLGKNRDGAALIRTLIAAIDNAEAVEATPEQQSESFRKLGDPAGEVARRVLSAADIAAVLAREVASRLEAAEDYARNGRADEAAALRRSAEAVGAYLS